jgi:hypothetical protein
MEAEVILPSVLARFLAVLDGEGVRFRRLSDGKTPLSEAKMAAIVHVFSRAPKRAVIKS